MAVGKECDHEKLDRVFFADNNPGHICDYLAAQIVRHGHSPGSTGSRRATGMKITQKGDRRPMFGRGYYPRREAGDALEYVIPEK